MKILTFVKRSGQAKHRVLHFTFGRPITKRRSEEEVCVCVYFMNERSYYTVIIERRQVNSVMHIIKVINEVWFSPSPGELLLLLLLLQTATGLVGAHAFSKCS